MSYKSEINETETEIILGGIFSINKSTGNITFINGEVNGILTYNGDDAKFSLSEQLEITGSLSANGISSSSLDCENINLTALNTAPTSATDTGVEGEIRITADYIYICTATDTWKRVAISTWVPT